MTAPARTRSGHVEIDRQHSAILEALDKLFALETPRAGKPVLHLVQSGDLSVGDRAGEGLRAFIIRRGWDLWAYGGELELFGAMRAVMAAQPSRQMWNRTVLSSLWADIGVPERKGA
jgi:hypothetical protein